MRRSSPNTLRILAFSTAAALVSSLGVSACSQSGAESPTSVTSTVAPTTGASGYHAWLVKADEASGTVSFTTETEGESGTFSCDKPGDVMIVKVQKGTTEKSGLAQGGAICADGKVETNELTAEILDEVAGQLALLPN